MNLFSLKSFGIWLFGAVSGLVIAAVSLGVFYVSGGLDVFLKNTLYSQPSWPSVTVGSSPLQASSTGATASGTGAATTSIVVSKSISNASYQQNLSAAVTYSNNLAVTNASLVAELQDINNKSVAKDYAGLFDVVYQAKTLVANEQVESTQLAAALSGLDAANQSTTDANISALTSDFITTGDSMNAALTTYMAAVNVLLSGSVPTVDQLSAFSAAAASLSSASENFNTSATNLFSAIAIKNAASAKVQQ